MTYSHSHSSTLDKALTMIDSGQELEADDFLVAQKQKALAKFGKNSEQYGTALYEHGYALILTGNVYEAKGILHDLLEILSAGQLKSPTLLGSACFRLGVLYLDEGSLLEAEQMLRDCAGARKEAFGENHPEYLACILELAHVQILKESPQDATQYLTNCIAGFHEIQDLLLWQALALKTVVDVQFDRPTPELSLVKELNSDDVAILLEPFSARLQSLPAKLRLQALEQLVGVVVELAHVPLDTRLEYMFYGTAQDRSDMDLKMSEHFVKQAIRLAKKEGHGPEAVVSLTTLASVYVQFGLADKADEAIRNALQEAKAHAPSLVAVVLIDWALLMDLCLDITSALELCTQALNVARQQGDSSTETSANVIMGVLHYHKGEAGEAAKIFANMRANRRLSDDDNRLIETHIYSREKGNWCSCFGDVDQYSLYADVVDRLDPQERFKQIIAAVSFSESGGVDVQLSDKPSPMQRELMNQIAATFLEELDEQRRLASSDRTKQYR